MSIFDVFSSAQSNLNQIQIHATKPQYFAGEIVEGTVSVRICVPQNVEGIHLKLKGYEHASFPTTQTYTTVDSRGRTQTHTRVVTSSATNVFFRRLVRLFSLKSIMAPGMFVFPFKFQLDHGLPGTFEAKKDFSAKILYKIKAEIAVPGFFKANIKHSQRLIVNELLTKSLAPYNAYQEANVTFLCCISKGRVSLNVSLDKNAYAPGDTVQLRLAVDNSQSKVTLKSTSLILCREILLRAKGESFSTYSSIVNAETPAVPRGEVVERFIQLQLPIDAEPSTRGSIVRCNYYLVVELSVPWSPNVRVTQEVQLYVPMQATSLPMAGYPPEISPTVYPLVQIDQKDYRPY